MQIGHLPKFCCSDGDDDDDDEKEEEEQDDYHHQHHELISYSDHWKPINTRCCIR